MKKFTLIELLVVIAIIGILVSILMPGLVKARYKVKMAVCLNNQRQYAVSALIYATSNDRIWPARQAQLDPDNTTSSGFAWQRADQKQGSWDDADVFNNGEFDFSMICPFPGKTRVVAEIGMLPDGKLDDCPTTEKRKHPYAFYFGWSFGGIVNRRVGDNLTYNGEEFDTIVSDIYQASQGSWIHTYHPDKSPNMLVSPWLDYSTSWSNNNSSQHGKIDLNYARLDGSAFIIQNVVSEDSRLSKVPRKISHNASGTSSNWSRLPAME